MAAWRICLVDDDQFVRDGLALGLRDAGFEVFTAPGAAAGLDIAARQTLDAIVTDINMPSLDGRALIAEARARWPQLAIIAISGSATSDQGDTAERAKASGADATLIKPFRAQLLAQTLISSIEARRRLPA